jgi:molybdopterin synthase catalytic subunit
VRITVRFFAILRDKAGTAQLPLDLPAGATVATARDALAERLPDLRGALARVAFAINQEYARPDALLHDNDELALIPPVSGG